MRFVFAMMTVVVVVFIPFLIQSQAQSQQISIVPSLNFGLKFTASCDQGIAIYKIQNQGQRWAAKAMITLTSESGDVLLQRAMRMSKNQTMSYRVRDPGIVGGILAVVDYPGSPRMQNALGSPCG